MSKWWELAQDAIRELTAIRKLLEQIKERT